MCGIFGVVLAGGIETDRRSVSKMAECLFLLSESRGREAAGLAVRKDNAIKVFKTPLAASRMIRSRQYKEFLSDALKTSDGQGRGGLKGPISFIGHSRLVTNGQQTINANNQPVTTSRCVGVHNGIIVNVDRLWAKYAELERRLDVDTEVFLRLLEKFSEESGSFETATSKVFAEIEGAASVAVYHTGLEGLLLATNTGSLYACVSEGSLAFASENKILEQFKGSSDGDRFFGTSEVVQISPGTGVIVELAGQDVKRFNLEKAHVAEIKQQAFESQIEIVDFSAKSDPRNAGLRRCSRCILPETFPMIEFDEDGVCNHCRNYRPYKVQGRGALEQLIEPYRRGSGQNCIVAFSGGRDSSYMLHYIKTELGLNPIAYTYDWGMVTDLARRNIARITGKLGIEHLLISADIRKKRDYIRRNVRAWFRSPDLGLVPLFMAGDKRFLHYGRELRRDLGVPLVFYGQNPLEKTCFKSAFAGIAEPPGRAYEISSLKKLKMIWYYLWRFLKNPAFLNRSIVDTASAFRASYMTPHDYTFFYRYIRWDEKTIEETLKREYDWETASDTGTTWRIGDGTASFYNYIYYTIAGFSEFDTFRSNQIREGIMTREQAMALVEIENEPRFDSMEWYAQVVGFDLDRAIRVINSVPKRWET